MTLSNSPVGNGYTAGSETFSEIKPKKASGVPVGAEGTDTA